MSNPTAIKFGYPRSLVAENTSWLVLLRPRQPALGSLVLVCKEPAQTFSALSAAAFADLQSIVQGVERTLKTFVSYERINYLMLMMIYPDVHLHVIPRYSKLREYGGVMFGDAGWPDPPQLAQAVALSPELLTRLAAELRQLWQREAP